MKGKNKQAVHICCMYKKKKNEGRKEGVFSRRPAPRILSGAASVCLRRNEKTPAKKKKKAFFIFTQ